MPLIRTGPFHAVLALAEAARWSPSCFGDEPWRYIVFDRQTDSEAWQKAFDCLAEGNQNWAAAAPLLLLAVAGLRFSSNEKANRWAQYDTGAASMSLCIQATSMDLMVHQMGECGEGRGIILHSRRV